MAEVQHAIDVEVPPKTAYDCWTRFESFPMFMSGVRDVSKVGAGRTHWVTEVAGIRREFDAQVTRVTPGELVAWTTLGGDTVHAGVVTFEAQGEPGGSVTRVTVRLVWEPDGLLEKVGGALGLDALQVKADLIRFKEFVEDDRVRTSTTPAQPTVAASHTYSVAPAAGG